MWEEVCNGVLEGGVGFVRVGVRALVLDRQDLGEGDDGYEIARGGEGGAGEGRLAVVFALLVFVLYAGSYRAITMLAPRKFPSCNGPRYGGQYLKTLGVRKIFTTKYFELLDSEKKGDLWTLAAPVLNRRLSSFLVFRSCVPFGYHTSPSASQMLTFYGSSCRISRPRYSISHASDSPSR